MVGKASGMDEDIQGTGQRRRGRVEPGTPGHTNTGYQKRRGLEKETKKVNRGKKQDYDIPETKGAYFKESIV